MANVVQTLKMSYKYQKALEQWLNNFNIHSTGALSDIYPEKLAKKAKTNLKKIKKLSMQFDRQHNSALYSEFSGL